MDLYVNQAFDARAVSFSASCVSLLPDQFARLLTVLCVRLIDWILPPPLPSFPLLPPILPSPSSPFPVRPPPQDDLPDRSDSTRIAIDMGVSKEDARAMLDQGMLRRLYYYISTLVLKKRINIQFAIYMLAIYICSLTLLRR